ncbi:hypothetical protein [Streptomyces collinus]|uniref:hypothetical protein n=1 Tax=Streptomyces collinus TaxID=42684 RepID=UPI00340D9CD0
MRIEILDLLSSVEAGGVTEVVFSGGCGRAWAQWCGFEEPKVRALVDVEVDIPDGITSWAIADGPAIVASGAPGAPVRIRGVVEAADEDYVVAVRVGADVVLVEVADAAASLLPELAGKPQVGDSIEFTTPQIEVHPYSV